MKIGSRDVAIILGFLATATWAGCMGADHEAARRTLAALDARDARHHDASTAMSDMAVLRAETLAYADDMQGLIDEMWDLCTDMMGSGTMHNMMGGSGHSYGDMKDMLDRMETGVHEHAAAIGGLDDLDAMRDACDAHHRSMSNMISQMGKMMGGGGMMM